MQIVKKVEEGMDPKDILCTTYQMRNFYAQFADGFFSNLDVMNYIQHEALLKYVSKGDKVLDVCCGRSLILPLIRWKKENIHSYTGVDICEANVREAKRRSGIKNIEDKPDYYPFKVNYVIGNVAEMANFLEPNSFDYVIYTSSVEHMQKEAGEQSLRECFKVMKPGARLFISCPNTVDKKDPYDTQYAAHLYEWNAAELCFALNMAGFVVEEKFGLLMKKRKMDEFFETKANEMWRQVYKAMSAYLPTAWLTAFMAIPFPNEADEVAIVCKKPM